MTHDKAKELLAEVIAIRDAQQKEIAQLQYRATGRVPIYALSIGDFPPPMRNDPIACLRFFFCTMFHYATPGEFDALTPDELKARVENNAAFEKMKEFWNGKIDELNKGIAAARDELADSADRTQFAIQKGFEELEPTKNGVEFLVGKRQMKIIKGREAQKNADADPYITKPKERAAADMARAVEKVRNDPGVKSKRRGALKAACIRVCDEFEGTGRKLSNGKFSQYAPLMDWQMKPIKWESLRRAYNKRHGRLRKAKSGAKSKPQTVAKSKPKRVTK